MKRFTTETEDTCWRDAIACILEIKPSEVPDFVKLYKGDYMNKTRDWLKGKFKKGLVYIPVRHFMETGKLRFNAPMGPSGFSIGYMDMVDGEASHAVVCFNGGVLWDNGDDRSDEYHTIQGYFIIYDLEIKKKKKKSRRIKKKKKKTS